MTAFVTQQPPTRGSRSPTSNASHPSAVAPSRFGYSALLVASLTMMAVVGSLLATEPVLPGGTRVAFFVMVGIRPGWATFAAWVLSNRRVMFGRDRLIAARMALTFAC